MGSSEALVRDLMLLSKDGEWGEAEPADHHVAMAVIRGTDFDAVRSGDLSGLPTRYIPEPRAARKRLQPGDVLIETAGGTKGRPTGRTIFLRPDLVAACSLPITCASFSRFLRVDPQLAEPEYIFWYLQYLYGCGEIELYQVQHTGISRFQYTSFAESTFIPLLSREIQRVISHSLGLLDRRVELNHRTSRTLGALSRAIFKSWFVDFDPVCKKMEGKSDNELGLPPSHAAAFPPRMTSTLGIEHPEGWDCVELGDLVSERTQRVGSSPDAVVLSAVSSGQLVRSDNHFNKRVYSKDLSKYKTVLRHDLAYNPSRINIGSIGMLHEDVLGAVSPVYVVFTPRQGYADFVDFLMRE